ncbi:3729_t:CDS:2, partial [Paraglomus occultum]
MKIQFTATFAIVLLALTSYTQAQGRFFPVPGGPCTVFLQGNFAHQTGNGVSSGCFGLDETDPIRTINVGPAVSSWTLFSDFNCQGNTLASS